MSEGDTNSQFACPTCGSDTEVYAVQYGEIFRYLDGREEFIAKDNPRSLGCAACEKQWDLAAEADVADELAEEFWDLRTARKRQ